ncbi:MAG: hypothetical protein C0168_10720 [Candidatus Aminicenantes bacterium]|nr:MAG: hypothetical protein C0168_10720 [Candidatus Aminicenantes bacterium]
MSWSWPTPEEFLYQFIIKLPSYKSRVLISDESFYFILYDLQKFSARATGLLARLCLQFRSAGSNFF